MAIINAARFKNTAGIGGESKPQRPNNFKNVFITGDPRPGMSPGTLGIFLDGSIPDNDPMKYLEKNAQSLVFLPLQKKRVRFGEEERVGKNGDKFMVPTYFDWDAKPGPEGTRQRIILAGVLASEEDSNILQLGPEYAKYLYKNLPLVHFNLKGIKFQAGIDMEDYLKKLSPKPEPITDDPEFDNQILYLRFSWKVTVGITKTANHGNKYTPVFTAHQELLPDTVGNLLDIIADTEDIFKKQFDLTDYVQKSTGQPSEDSEETAPALPNEPPPRDPQQAQYPGLAGRKNVTFENPPPRNAPGQGGVALPPRRPAQAGQSAPPPRPVGAQRPAAPPASNDFNNNEYNVDGL